MCIFSDKKGKKTNKPKLKKLAEVTIESWDKNLSKDTSKACKQVEIKWDLQLLFK